MPTFVIPLTCRVRVPANQFSRIRRHFSTEVAVSALNRDGHARRLGCCLIDTGCSTTMMSAVEARAAGIPFPMDDPQELTLNTANGTVRSTVYDGELKLQFDACPGHTSRLFCLFSENYTPAAPILLGLHDLIEVFRVTFDGTRSPGSELGCVTFATYP